MRIRKRRWEDEELEKFEINIKEPEKNKGKWKQLFQDVNQETEVHIEIGCGKGIFISKKAKKSLDEKENIKFIGIDVEDTMLAMTKRSIENEWFNITNEEREDLSKKVTKITSDFRKENNLYYGEKIREDLKEKYEEYVKVALKEISENYLRIYEITNEKGYKKENYPNILITRKNAETISNTFSKEDNVTRIYLNFSNPWPKDRHNKRRLTHNTKLEQYKEFLSGNKEIYFKTDDDELFEESRQYFKEEGFEEIKVTFDLKNEDIFNGNIKTEHEEMFEKEGKNIKAGIYRLK